MYTNAQLTQNTNDVVRVDLMFNRSGQQLTIRMPQDAPQLKPLISANMNPSSPAIHQQSHCHPN